MDNLLNLLLLLLMIGFGLAISRSLRLSKISVSLIEKYEHDKSNPKLIEEIFVAINKDIFLARTFKQNNGTKEDIIELHAKLMRWGDFRKYNRYIPVTSFFNLSTLSYLLKHKNDNAKILAAKMMNHFHF